MTKCFICNYGSLDKSSFHRHIDRRKGLKGSWTIGQCSHCNIESLYPRPSEEELNSFYEAYYDEGKFVFRKEKHSNLAWLRKLYHKFTEDVDPRDFISPSAKAKILDYGCGGASYIQYFHNKGYDIWGADVSDEVVSQSKLNGLNVKKVNDFDEIPFPSDHFDIVYLMQVFEHLRDPNTFLKELNRVLVDRGHLYISIPNADSIWRRIFKKNWISGYFAPFHLAHYSEKTLTVLAEKYGFKVEKTFYRTPESWFRLNVKAFWHSEINDLGLYSSWIDSKLARVCLNVLLRAIEFPIRNRDCMTMHLRKDI